MADSISFFKNYHAVSISTEQEVNGGVYLLGIALGASRRLTFGKYNQGEPVSLQPGQYLYIGSAYGSKGSSSLGYRLLRHTCRSGERPPHRIQPELYRQIQAGGLPGKIPAGKKLRWHIDYLLDLQQAEIFYVHALRTTARLEQAVAQALAAMPETGIFASGLGASDHPGGTHLFIVDAPENWWRHLPNLLLNFT